jgi:hypothetical protein
MRIATGEEIEEVDSVKSAAAELGSRGGKARAAKMTTWHAPVGDERLWPIEQIPDIVLGDLDCEFVKSSP